MLIPEFNKYPKPTDWNSLYILAQQAFENGFRAFTLQDLLSFIEGGGSAISPNVAPFKLRLGDEQVTVDGDDTVILDSRLLGITDYPINSTQLNNSSFRADELEYNSSTGSARILNFRLQAGEEIVVIPAVGTSGAGNPMQPILDRITKLERMVAPILSGGRMLWTGSTADIPAGWVIDTDWNGRVPVGLNPPDADFNVIGKTGGSKSAVLMKTNLPDITLEVQIPPDNTSIGHKGGGKIVTGGEASSASPAPLKTEALGNGTPIDIMNPYRVGCWIKYVGV